jgi:hypothetical protein
VKQRQWLSGSSSACATSMALRAATRW